MMSKYGLPDALGCALPPALMGTEFTGFSAGSSDEESRTVSHELPCQLGLRLCIENRMHSLPVVLKLRIRGLSRYIDLSACRFQYRSTL